MKNLTLTSTIAAIGMVGVLASPAIADIATSPHNMQTHITDTSNESNGEICVFCHTPHGADTSMTAPLWNRTAGGTGYLTYDSASVDGEVLAVGSVSAACLGCHDGASNIDVVINAPGSTVSGGANNNDSIADPFVMAGFKAIGEAGAGDQLQNDHPIGVQYGLDSDFVAPQTDGTYNWVDSKFAGQTPGQRDKEDMILYNRTYASGNQFGVECGSCHDPHNTSMASNDTQGVPESNQVNFLRMSNAGSDLCLSCHTK